MQTIRLVKTGRVQESGVRYTSPGAIYGLIRDMSRLDREHFIALHLNGKNNVIAKETISIGTLQNSLVHPREVFKGAILNGSASVIVAHNHPSGDPAPSNNDREITARLKSAGELLGVYVLDHIIVGDGRYYTFNGEGVFRADGTPIIPAKSAGAKNKRSRKRSLEKTE